MHRPVAGSRLEQLYSQTISCLQLPLFMRLEATRLLSLACVASPSVFWHYKASLETILQCEASGRAMRLRSMAGPLLRAVLVATYIGVQRAEAQQLLLVHGCHCWHASSHNPKALPQWTLCMWRHAGCMKPISCTQRLALLRSWRQ